MLLGVLKYVSVLHPIFSDKMLELKPIEPLYILLLYSTRILIMLLILYSCINGKPYCIYVLLHPMTEPASKPKLDLFTNCLCE